MKKAFAMCWQGKKIGSHNLLGLPTGGAGVQRQGYPLYLGKLMGVSSALFQRFPLIAGVWLGLQLLLRKGRGLGLGQGWEVRVLNFGQH